MAIEIRTILVPVDFSESARAVIEWSGAKRPTSLRHDAAEAILIGLWGALELGWLAELPQELTSVLDLIEDVEATRGREAGVIERDDTRAEVEEWAQRHRAVDVERRHAVGVS